MPFNIDSIDIVDGALFATGAHVNMFNALVKARGEHLAEGWELGPSVLLDGGLESIPWHGEFSGNGEPLLREFLALTAGKAALLICWEGGDSYTGLVVEHGKVYDGKVVQTVVRE